MAKFKVNNADKALLDQMALDNDTLFRNGLTAGGVDYAINIAPVSGYDLIIPSGSDAYTRSLDGIKAGMAISVKYMAPFFVQNATTNVSPTKTFRSTPTALVSYTFTDEISVPRQALVSAQFGIYVPSTPSHQLEYYVSVDGVETPHLTHYIADTNQHLVSGSWIVSLQGNPTVTLYAFKAGALTGANFSIDSTCSINMTIAG